MENMDLFGKLTNIIAKGEGLTVEFKSCTTELNDSVFETVCSFSNRFGGFLFLGVDDDGKILGIKENCILNIKRNFINILNNSNKINPSLYLELSELEIDGKTILWTYVPPSSDIVLCNGKVFDRNGDADQNITRSVTRIADMSTRKSRFYSERQIFPYLRDEHLRFDLLPKVRQLAAFRNPNHPWLSMTDAQLLRSAGLYEENYMTGEKGYNLAAILLLGKDEVIHSCLPAYCTDAIFRDQNQDRYDDRLIVDTNLIDSYDMLMEFVRKHTDDRFFLIDGQSAGVRDLLAREIISNTLVHREYSSAFPAKLVIDRQRLYTENWSKAIFSGKLDPSEFTPYPKNPLIAKFFMTINRADSLGSGVRNLYKYSLIYTGGEPCLEEGDVFKATIPLVRTEGPASPKVSNAQKVRRYLDENGSASASELLPVLGFSSKTSVQKVIYKMKNEGWIVSEGSGRSTRYRLTDDVED